MCLVCAQWELGKLTSKEALRNLGEVMSLDKSSQNDHYLAVVDAIMAKEVGELKIDNSETEHEWHDEIYNNNE